MKRVVFIGGVHGRTGTTVLKRILCHHPDVSSVGGGETRAMEAVCELWPNLIRKGSYTPANALAAFAEFCDWARSTLGDTPQMERALSTLGGKLSVRYVRLPGRARGAMPSPVSEAALACVLGEFLHVAFEAVALDPSRHVLCEKTPSNALYLPLLRKIMPEARIVVMMRDPLDIALSHTRRDWGPADPLEAAIYTRAHFRRWARLVPDDASCLMVRHEDLVADPGAGITRVLDHLGLVQDEGLLRYAASELKPSVKRTGDLAPHHLSLVRSSLREERKAFGYDDGG